MIPNSCGGTSREIPKFQFPIQKTHQETPMTQNDPESTVTTFSGQNGPKPVLSVKINQNPLFRSTTGVSSQNRPEPLFSAKIDQNQFCSVKPQFSRPKSTETIFILAKIGRNHFFRSNPSFSGQNRRKPVFSAKIDQNQWQLEKFQAENRKMKTARCRPKRDKQTPFSSVLIPGLDLGIRHPNGWYCCLAPFICFAGSWCAPHPQSSTVFVYRRT